MPPSQAPPGLGQGALGHGRGATPGLWPAAPRGHSQGQLWSCPGRQERPQRASSHTWHSGPCRLSSPELAARALWPLLGSFSARRGPPYQGHGSPGLAACLVQLMRSQQVPAACRLGHTQLEGQTATECVCGFALSRRQRGEPPACHGELTAQGPPACQSRQQEPGSPLRPGRLMPQRPHGMAACGVPWRAEWQPPEG